MLSLLPQAPTGQLEVFGVNFEAEFIDLAFSMQYNNDDSVSGFCERLSTPEKKREWSKTP